MNPRPADVSRLVVKVGTSSLTSSDGEPDLAGFRRLVSQVADAHDRGVGVCIVSSGAIACGLRPLGFKRRPSDMAGLQAAAAVGQRRLMDIYASLLAKRGITAGQVLLTRFDMVHRRQYVNARNTLERLLTLHAIPIVNENDTVATDEIRYGDNDLLAALVANLVRADLLLMLSDVDGVYSLNPKKKGAQLIDQVDEITPDLMRRAARGRSSLGSGGMVSKLEAARMATLSGVGAVVASGSRKGVIELILGGEKTGTYFPPRRKRPQARKLWIAWAPAATGRIVVDQGATRALSEGNRSLLAAGVKGVEGSFGAGDVVEVVDPGGAVFAKGIVRFPSEAVADSAGRKGGGEVIHRDHLVML